MSIEVMAQVWKLDLPNHLILMLIAMADWADDDGGNVYPSVAHLAWKTSQSERGAQRGLKALRDLGIAIKVGVKIHGNVEYRLDFSKVPRKAPWVPGSVDSRSDNMSYPPSSSESSDTSDGDAEVGHVVPAEADTGDAEVGHVVPAEADTTVLQAVSQPSLETLGKPSVENQVKESLPDYMIDLLAVNEECNPKHPFKKTQTEMVVWMQGKNITPRKADETAAYIKGNWPGPSKTWKDVAAVFRTCVVKTFDNNKSTGSGARRTRSDALPTTEELKKAWG